jgi:hypothetical protein
MKNGWCLCRSIQTEACLGPRIVVETLMSKGIGGKPVEALPRPACNLYEAALDDITITVMGLD